VKAALVDVHIRRRARRNGGKKTKENTKRKA
jgi:hypothetical protein